MAEIKKFILEDDPPPDNKTAESIMLFALKGLSQRAIGAIKDLFILLSIASVFWLFLSIHEPNTFQLIELTLYGAIILAANVIVRRA